MIYTLVVVITRHSEEHPNTKFFSMDAPLEWVKTEGYEWTSLVVTVLPKAE